MNLFTNPALHDIVSTLDGEMKCVNATGNYMKYVPNTVKQENRLLEMGLLGNYNADVL